ncbi:MAG TPA: divergent polysaccharide deacetylase family protein [Stellaceae bacterium]|nr:divergent polysaccharide deacetylase family protein [Stellaceae bacterium]
MDQKLHDFYALLHRRDRAVAVPELHPPRSRKTGMLLLAVLAATTAVALAVWLAGSLGRTITVSSTVELRRDPLPSVASVALPPPIKSAAVVAPPPSAPVSSPPQTAMVPLQPEALTRPAKPEAPAATPAWIRYAIPAPPKDARPRIAIVIDDLGLDRRRTERAIALPGPLTLSFLAYASDLPRQTEAAHRAGHELLLHVPMEPIGKVLDASPNELDVGLSEDEVLQRLRWDLGRFQGYVGINNHMGSKFTSDSASMRPVMEELHRRGLLFLDSRTIGSTTGMDLARELGVPHAGRDVFLDNDVSTSAIAVQFAELERIAKRNGNAIAIGHPHDQTLDVLQKWLDEAPSRGFVVVPVSAIVKDRGVAG